MSERVLINLVLVPAFNEAALIKALDESAERKPDGVAFVAVDTDPVREACARLTQLGIHTVTLVSDLDRSSRAHYVGIDNGAAGRTAAHLLGLFANGTGGAIAVIAGSLKVHDHLARFEGFKSAMESGFSGREILPVLEGFDEGARVEKLVLELLEKHKDVAGIYSRVQAIAVLSARSQLPETTIDPGHRPRTRWCHIAGSERWSCSCCIGTGCGT